MQNFCLRTLVTFVFTLGLAATPLVLSCHQNDDVDDATGGPGDGRNKGLDGENGGTGVTPRDFLSGSTYKRLVVEIQAMEGYEPTESARNSLKHFLTSRLNKPSGLVFVSTGIKAVGKSSYSIDEVRAIEDANRRYFTEGDRIVAYFLFVDGASASDNGGSKVLGHAYRNTSMVIYEKTIQSLAGLPPLAPEKSSLEAVVMQHEMGHTLGLVNNGTGMVGAHQDTANGRHCSNSQCLMYYQAETNDLLPFLQLVPSPTLDSACLQDLQANGGK